MKQEKMALVLQGGALRTVFTAGVLDAFISQNFYPFSHYIGVSGGAMCLSYYLGNQYRVTLEIIKALSEDKDFINILNAFKEEGVVNLNHLKHFTTSEYPINYSKAIERTNTSTVEFVATNIDTGKPEYLTPTLNNWNDCLIASSTLPIYTKGIHEIDGKKLMDGGWSAPIPVERAIELGATKIVVIRTTPKEKDNLSYIGYLSSFLNKEQEAWKKCLKEEHLYYNSAINFMNKQHEGIEIYQIVPPKKLKTSSHSSSIKRAEHDYRLGLDLGLQFVLKNQGLFK